MGTMKLASGSRLPEITLPLLGGGTVTLGNVQNAGNWQLIFVYRGLHCPLCKQYLAKLESLKDQFLASHAEIVAVSSDPEEKAKAMTESTELTFPVAYGLSIEQMQDLGLYISHPRSPQETDRPFPEPGMFAVNAEGKVHLIDISNTPFNRSNPEELLETVEWIQENDYPIRGTYEYSGQP
ncbi:MAG: redoxin family protein [Nitrospirales bacterium]|nr:redoxin family protein [Nitrospirales bacterium]